MEVRQMEQMTKQTNRRDKQKRSQAEEESKGRESNKRGVKRNRARNGGEYTLFFEKVAEPQCS